MFRHSGEDDELADLLQESGDRRGAAAVDFEFQVFEKPSHLERAITDRLCVCSAVCWFRDL